MAAAPLRAPDETNGNAKSERKPVWWLDYARAGVEFLGFVGVIVALIFTANSVTAAKDAVETSTAQLEESQYESVYQHQLDLWRLAAENPELAPYIVGGKRPAFKNPNDLSPTEAAQMSAVINALDFHAYVFSQYAPRDQFGNAPADVLTAEERPSYIDAEFDWDEWRTWAETIVAGFKGAPGMCDELGLTKNDPTASGDPAYEESFRNAVRLAVPECTR